MGGGTYPRRKTVTLSVTVTAPGWLRKADVRREVRCLINDGAPWGMERPEERGGDFEMVELGDVRVRRVR